MRKLVIMGAICSLSLISCGGGGSPSPSIGISDSIAGTMHETESHKVAKKVIFHRYLENDISRNRTQLTYDWGEQILPNHLMTGKDESFYYGVLNVEKPNSQVTTQYANFSFESKGIFTSNPNFHFAVILSHEGTGRWNRGRGFIVGNLDFPNNFGEQGCKGAINSTPETWYMQNEKPKNNVYNGGYCGSSLNDYQKYNVTMSSTNDDSWIYEIKDLNGNIVGGGKKIIDSYATNPDKDLISKELKGFAIGIVFADNKNTPFQMVFDNIEVGWR